MTLSVSVGGAAVAQVNGEYQIPSDAAVTVACSMPCTFTATAQNGAAATNARTGEREWSADVRLASLDARLSVSAQATSSAVSAVRADLVAQRPVPSASYWTTDSRTYTREQSLQQLNSFFLGDAQHFYRSLVMQSTKPNGCESAELECSVISLNLFATEPGDYPVDPNYLANPSQAAVGVRINVKVFGKLGPDGIYYNDDYRPASGTIRVTRDSQGVFHYATVGSFDVHRLPGAGGASQAPASMTFRMVDGQ